MAQATPFSAGCCVLSRHGCRQDLCLIRASQSSEPKRASGGSPLLERQDALRVLALLHTVSVARESRSLPRLSTPCSPARLLIRRKVRVASLADQPGVPSLIHNGLQIHGALSNARSSHRVSSSDGARTDRARDAARLGLRAWRQDPDATGPCSALAVHAHVTCVPSLATSNGSGGHC